MKAFIRIILRKIRVFILDLRYNIRCYFQKKKDIENGSVCIVTHDLYKGGAEILLLNVVKQFKEMNQNCCVISLRPGPLYDEFDKYASVHVVSKFNLKKFISVLEKKEICKKVIINTIVSGEITPLFKERGFHTCLLIHEMAESIRIYFGNGYRNKVTKIIDCSDVVVFPSTYVYTSFLKCIHERKFNYIIHDQGMYMENIDISSSSIDKEEVLERYDIPNKAKVIINVGTADFRKGFDLFINLAQKMKEIDNNIFFIWVGVSDEIKYRSCKLGLKSGKYGNLRLPGYIDSRERLMQLCACSDAMFLTSREDPFPAVVLNSFAVGTPVVAFESCGGFTDIIKEGVTGYLFTPFDIESSTKYLQELVYDKNKLMYMREQCMAEAKKHDFKEYCRFLLDL